GTGSHDVLVEDVFVPAARCFDFRSTQARPHDPLAALPLFSRLGGPLVAVAVGIARRALEELIALAERKLPMASQAPLRERASAPGPAAAPRPPGTDAASAVFARVPAGGAPSLEDQIRLRLAYVTAAESAARAVDLVRNAAGMDGLVLGSPLERSWRDLHAVTQHFAISPHHLERLGKPTLGLDPGPGPA